MTFLSILLALLGEQFHPLRADNAVYGAVKAFGLRMETWFNAGDAMNGRIAWILTCAALAVPAGLGYWICLRISPFLALLWNVAILYLTLGFRHYSHHFTSIQLALNAGDDATARSLLAQWTGADTSMLEGADVARLAVEKALITTHRNVFGVFFWYLVPLGPAGAVLYRVAEHLARAWNEPEHMKSEAFGAFAARAFYWLDWMPARLTAVAFAIVGNFEDAIYTWRSFASRWQDEAVGIILSAGSGAMGIRLGSLVHHPVDSMLADAVALDGSSIDLDDPIGEEATARALQSTVGLVWRALLLWMLLLLLLSIAVWLGRPLAA
ncbi:MAG: CobD/CbiB family protein [Burkholderiaceae bacterium]